MPASGKSTVGVLLAKRLSKAFIDTDLVIQAGESRALRDIIRTDGLAAFRNLEQRYVCALDPHDSVISTGGSVIYSDGAVAHLRSLGGVYFLDATLEEVRSRIGDLDERGFVRNPGQSLEDVYQERRPRYLAAADHVIDCAGCAQGQVVERLVTQVRGA